MKILVTGITGLFGSYLAREFLNLGELHGLRRKSSQLNLLADLSDHIVWHEGDINDYDSLEETFDKMDLIVHAAGLVSYDYKDIDRLNEVNVEGTANVVNAMLQKKIKNLVYISSVAALGRSAETLVIDEKHKWTSSPLNTPYGISKYLAELEVWRGAQEGLKVMIFNPSVLLAKITDQRSSAAIYQYVLQENRYYPLGSINYLDVRDAAQLIAQIYQKNRWNERFILSNEAIPYQTFFQTMAGVLQKKAPHIPVRGWMLNLAFIWLGLTRAFNRKKIPFNQQTAKLAQATIVYDNQKATELTGFKYTSLESTFAWARGTESNFA
jgi:dihydroflavonol-4-reductase